VEIGLPAMALLAWIVVRTLAISNNEALSDIEGS
jgi:hypothetical protein